MAEFKQVRIELMLSLVLPLQGRPTSNLASSWKHTLDSTSPQDRIDPTTWVAVREKSNEMLIVCADFKRSFLFQDTKSVWVPQTRSGFEGDVESMGCTFEPLGLQRCGSPYRTCSTRRRVRAELSETNRNRRIAGSHSLLQYDSLTWFKFAARDGNPPAAFQQLTRQRKSPTDQ
ncbi:hypothetical protein CDAR_476641 [Caerostris darwini]|uniref:Uncharacterized protein n=1 Tax=Caerostris darwini TaxID=1538125 RepID=A0AAV4VA37_9ARAC|nr:hypothetical protein CDAR_476641 [Caerostris darwini]